MKHADPSEKRAEALDKARRMLEVIQHDCQTSDVRGDVRELAEYLFDNELTFKDLLVDKNEDVGLSDDEKAKRYDKGEHLKVIVFVIRHGILVEARGRAIELLQTYSVLDDEPSLAAAARAPQQLYGDIAELARVIHDVPTWLKAMLGEVAVSRTPDPFAVREDQTGAFRTMEHGDRFSADDIAMMEMLASDPSLMPDEARAIRKLMVENPDLTADEARKAARAAAQASAEDDEEYVVIDPEDPDIIYPGDDETSGLREIPQTTTQSALPPPLPHLRQAEA